VGGPSVGRGSGLWIRDCRHPTRESGKQGRGWIIMELGKGCGLLFHYCSLLCLFGNWP
jgi:hypothetical protein